MECYWQDLFTDLIPYLSQCDMLSISSTQKQYNAMIFLLRNVTVSFKSIITEFKYITYLKLSRNDYVVDLALLPKLIHLCIKWESAKFRNFESITQLVKLEIKYNTDVESIDHLTNLTSLTLKGFHHFNIINLTNLRTLDLSHNGSTEDITKLTNLTELNLWGNKKVLDISTLTNLTSLDICDSQITRRDCRNLTKLKQLVYD